MAASVRDLQGFLRQNLYDACRGVEFQPARDWLTFESEGGRVRDRPERQGVGPLPNRNDIGRRRNAVQEDAAAVPVRDEQDCTSAVEKLLEIAPDQRWRHNEITAKFCTA